MAKFTVSPGELARIAGAMTPEANAVTSAGTAIGDTVGIGVGLGMLDGALASLAGAYGGWLAQSGADLQTLALNTEAAGTVYARVEADNAQSMGGGGSQGPACPPTCIA